MSKKIEDMNSMELKGVLFDLNSQIEEIKTYALRKVQPLLQKRLQEEAKTVEGKKVVSNNQTGGITANVVNVQDSTKINKTVKKK